MNPDYDKLVGKSYKGGKIIGISPTPKLSFSPGNYAVVTFPNKPSIYVPVEEIYKELTNDK